MNTKQITFSKATAGQTLVNHYGDASPITAAYQARNMQYVVVTESGQQLRGFAGQYLTVAR